MATKRKVIEAPFYPIIYVRGYAMTEGEVEDTVATPYMGFNLGATKIRQRWNKQVVKHIFESPLIRLMKDFEYQDSYAEGAALLDQTDQGVMQGIPETHTGRRVFVYRYYDLASQDFGEREKQDIEVYAGGLGRFILKIRDWVCHENKQDTKDFRIYLVAHSMGGLICRCFLQNPKCAIIDRGWREKRHRENPIQYPPVEKVTETKKTYKEAKASVDKVFTYATPHNGIDVNFLGNVPEWLTLNNAANFSRDRMRKYLGLSGDGRKGKQRKAGEETDAVNSLDGKFDPERFFCLVGTNHKDYTVAAGGVSKAIGEMSDGLVRIENATVKGAPRSFVHRSHSGHYGIVNSESGYQNLVRFLFGEVKVDGLLCVRSITLPPNLQEKAKQGRVRGSYHFESIVRVRGARWDLHRRTVETSSAIMRTYDELFKKEKSPRLFSAFLRLGARVVDEIVRPTLGFSVELGVLVPEYELDNKFWFDDHYDGGYIYRDKVNIEVKVPESEKEDWILQYGFDSLTPNQTEEENRAEVEWDGEIAVFQIPLRQLPGKKDPKMDATLEIRASRVV